MTPYLLVSGDFVHTGGMDQANLALASYLADRDHEVHLVTHRADKELAQRPNVIVRREVPQLALLRRVDAVVCHGGHNTVCEALAHGLPLVIAPIVFDQPGVAQLVVEAGAGIRVKFARVRARELRRAVDAVLQEPRYRLAAERIQESFRSAGGSAAAAVALEELARAPAPTRSFRRARRQLIEDR